eukprot:2010220-Amphidinium_carterae.2
MEEKLAWIFSSIASGVHRVVGKHSCRVYTSIGKTSAKLKRTSLIEAQVLASQQCQCASPFIGHVVHAHHVTCRPLNAVRLLKGWDLPVTLVMALRISNRQIDNALCYELCFQELH